MAQIENENILREEPAAQPVEDMAQCLAGLSLHLSPLAQSTVYTHQNTPMIVWARRHWLWKNPVSFWRIVKERCTFRTIGGASWRRFWGADLHF